MKVLNSWQRNSQHWFA